MIHAVETAALLSSLAEIEEKIADRGPIKVLPRTDAPNIPQLRAKAEVILKALRVKRKHKEPKGHDLFPPANPGDPQVPRGYDLSAIGVIEEIRTVKAGTDRALPKSTTIIRVVFPAGEHLYFDPADLEHAK